MLADFLFLIEGILFKSDSICSFYISKKYTSFSNFESTDFFLATVERGVLVDTTPDDRLWILD